MPRAAGALGALLECMRSANQPCTVVEYHTGRDKLISGRRENTEDRCGIIYLTNTARHNRLSLSRCQYLPSEGKVGKYSVEYHLVMN